MNMLKDNINMVLLELRADNSRAHYSVLDSAKLEIERLGREVEGLRSALNSPLNSAEHKFKAFVFDLMVKNKIQLDYYPDGSVDACVSGGKQSTYETAELAIVGVVNQSN